MWSLAWKNITRRKGQSLLTVILIFVTIALFVMIFAFSRNVQEALTLSQERMGADIMVLPGGSDPSGYTTLYTAAPSNNYMPETVLQAVSQVEGVEKATPQFFIQTLDASCCATDCISRIVGFDQETDFVLTPLLTEANQLPMTNEQMLLGGGINYVLGTRMGILGQLFQVNGYLTLTGTGMDEMYFIDIEQARYLAATNENLKEVIGEVDPEHSYSAVLIKGVDGADLGEIAQGIRDLGLEVEVLTVDTVIEETRAQLDAISQMMFFLWLALLLVTVLSLFGRFAALAQARKKEMGLLRALGGQKKDVFALLLLEACTLAAFGGILGSAVGLLLTNPLIAWLKSAFSFGVVALTPARAAGCLLFGCLLSLVLSVLSSLYPAWKTAELDPQEVMMRGDVD